MEQQSVDEVIDIVNQYIEVSKKNQDILRDTIKKSLELLNEMNETMKLIDHRLSYLEANYDAVIDASLDVKPSNIPGVKTEE